MSFLRTIRQQYRWFLTRRKGRKMSKRGGRKHWYRVATASGDITVEARSGKAAAMIARQHGFDVAAMKNAAVRTAAPGGQIYQSLGAK